MSTTLRRALTHVQISLAAAVVLAVAMVTFSPAPSAQAASRPVGERVVKIAASKAGTPYVYGASGPGAFDCSGFTSWVYARAGKRIPRTSSAQAAAAHRVRAGDARRGDLVFFTSGGRSTTSASTPATTASGTPRVPARASTSSASGPRRTSSAASDARSVVEERAKRASRNHPTSNRSRPLRAVVQRAT